MSHRDLTSSWRDLTSNGQDRAGNWRVGGEAWPGEGRSGREADRGAGGDSGQRPGEAAGPFFHVVSTFIDGRSIFWSDAEVREYFETAEQQWREYGIAVHGYCVLPDAVHWLVSEVGASEGERYPQQRISEAMMVTSSLCSRRFNRRMRDCLRPVQVPLGVQARSGRLEQQGGGLPEAVVEAVMPRSSVASGHNWRRNFAKNLVTPAEMAEAARRIELLPVTAGLVGHPGEYPYGSYRERVAVGTGVMALQKAQGLEPVPTGEDWAQFVAAGLTEIADKLSAYQAEEERARQAAASEWAANLRMKRLEERARELLGLGEQRWPERPVGFTGRIRHFVSQAVAYWSVSLTEVVIGTGRQWKWWLQAMGEGWFVGGSAIERTEAGWKQGSGAADWPRLGEAPG